MDFGHGVFQFDRYCDLNRSYKIKWFQWALPSSGCR